MNVLPAIAFAAGLAILGRPAAAQMAEYEVELRYTGYVAMAASPECEALAHANSSDVLTGVVKGMETAGADDDIMYLGTLKRTTALDFCQMRGEAWCIATLTGSADMQVEIEVYGESDRGAYVKAEAGTGPAHGEAKGNCSPADMREIQQDYPSGGSGGSPSGQPIDDAQATDAQGRHITFYAAGHARLRVGTYRSDPGGWALRVIRKIR
ncbi:MAG: hypothetical protein ABI836_12715 [Gemmatimonadota bacterium]